jgi:hypothetical protein
MSPQHEFCLAQRLPFREGCYCLAQVISNSGVHQSVREIAGSNHTIEASVGGRDDANSYANRLRITEPLKFVFLGCA